MFALRSSMLAALVLASGCASAERAPGGGAPAPAPAGPEAPAAAPVADRGDRAPALTAAEIEAIYRSRLEAARARYTEADVRFMTDMIHHHAQAIEISRLVPDRSASASIRTLAARIINAQQDEITTMQRWLADRNRPVPELHITDDGVMVHAPAGDAGAGGAAGHAGHARHPDQPGHDHADMPGMLTPEQIQELAAAEGVAFDRRFLELMIEHHQGAVTMVLDLFASDGAAQDAEVFRFASDVQVDQVTEVARMERMLATLPQRNSP
ncbi:MAG: DUF305 domain-containing protein [Gemmatimonadales bacterium]|nr:MAG: DUF305 domain-containing protein [Gemmatimonadales bacterium]